MSNSTIGPQVSAEARDALADQRLRVSPVASARRLWERAFTETQRNNLGGNFETAFTTFGGSIGMWVELMDVTPWRAIVDVGFSLNFLDPTSHAWLLRELGEEPDSTAPQTIPSWHSDTGILRFGDTRARRLRLLSEPSNIQRILDAFEAAGWPEVIRNPLSGGQQQLHEALRVLNQDLQGLRFQSQMGGATIAWRRS